MNNNTDQILDQNAEQRFQFLVSEVATKNTVWVLTDEYGCVMLNTEDEDCLPVWPSEEFAQAWATDEWQDCKAEAISFAAWQLKWTKGLIEDDLMLVTFPNAEQEGYILDPQDFEDAIIKKQTKLNR